MKVQVSELKLGDVVDLGFTDGYGTATVYKVCANGDVHICRPYVHVTDVIYAGELGSKKLVPYLGVEDFALYNGSSIELVRRNPVPLR